MNERIYQPQEPPKVMQQTGQVGQQPIQYAKPRNPDLDRIDVRFVGLKWSIGMLDREVQFRLKYSDSRAGRSQVMQEILGGWTGQQIIRAEIMLGDEKNSPFLVDHPIPVLAQPVSEDDYEDVRINVPKEIVDIIDRVVRYRCLYEDANTSRNSVINEILNTWANLQWHRATMTLRDNRSNPLNSERVEAPVHG